MIKFFRKIRQKMLTENPPESTHSVRAGKFSPPERRSQAVKYLLYAIGEIVLVVIGILIAIQINTWNQNRNRSQLETTLLRQLKAEMLDIYEDIYSDFNLLDLGSQSHFKVLDFIKKDVAYNDSMSFDFAILKKDEYIYPSDAVYSRIKEEGLDIIRNDSIRYLTQTLYESAFPRLSKINSFTPDISETLNDYYRHHFRINTDYNLKYNHTFHNDTISGKIYSESYKFPVERTSNGSKRKYTIGFIPLDFEALKKDDAFRILLGETDDYRNYKMRHYSWTKNSIKNLIRLIDKELEL